MRKDYRGVSKTTLDIRISACGFSLYKAFEWFNKNRNEWLKKVTLSEYKTSWQGGKHFVHYGEPKTKWIVYQLTNADTGELINQSAKKQTMVEWLEQR